MLIAVGRMWKREVRQLEFPETVYRSPLPSGYMYARGVAANLCTIINELQLLPPIFSFLPAPNLRGNKLIITTEDHQ